MTAYSTQGSRIEFAKEDSGIGSASGATYDDIRVEGTPTHQTPVGEAFTPSTVHVLPTETEKPLVFNRTADSAITMDVLVRQAATAGEKSFSACALESGGYDVAGGDNSTVSVYTSESDFTANDDNFAVGQAVNVELDDGTWVPTLIAAYSTGNITPTMALPSAASTSNALNKCELITPGSPGFVTLTDLLTFKSLFRAQDTGSDLLYQAINCALTGLGEVSLAPGEPIKFSFTFGSLDVTASTGTLGTNDFRDGTAHRVINEPWCQFASSNSAGGITAGYHKLISATFAPGVTCEVIPGTGDTGCKNNAQGWIKKIEPAKLTMTMLYDKQKLDDFDGNNPDKYVGIIQPGADEDDPAFGLWLPKAHLTSVTHEPWTDNEHRVTVEMTPQPAGLSSATGSSLGNAPWFMAIAADSTDV